MCGIAGEIRFDSEPPARERVEAMMRVLEPRGPDASGLRVDGPAAFGHRRLKIIDLTERAAQPMRDDTLGLTLVFNGCIYNHRELRSELEGAGYRFFSDSDTEVVLKAFHAWGHDCVQHFNGMFAFVLRRDADGLVFAARDRLGIKPFYFEQDRGCLRFASSLPALLAASSRTPELDPVALHHYLSFHAVVPPPQTLVQHVRKLEPGHWLEISRGGEIRRHRYWRPSFSRDPDRADMDFADWRDAVHAALRRSVERRMIADVPVGVLLSGGVDSSLVVGLLAECGVRDLNTFTIGFESVGEELGNEFEYSDIVAAEFGTRHHKLEISSAELVSHLPDCFRAMSEPMVSHDNIGFYLLSREVARHVKVVQSGQGADEVFGGYFWYPPMLESRAPVDDYAAAFFDRAHAEMADVLDPRWIHEDYSRDFVEAHFRDADATTAVDKALHIDTTVMLIDDPVKRVDNMTMAWGLEARVPFLDHELVELAARIPPEMKVSEGGKYVLKEAARATIPSAVIDRPKGYFPVPVLKYLRGESLQFVHDALNGRAARERGLFRRDYVDMLLADPEKHLTPLNGSKLWQVAVLEIWLQTHGI